jgi:hypothetical protein
MVVTGGQQLPGYQQLHGNQQLPGKAPTTSSLTLR